MVKSALLVNYPDLGERVYDALRDQIVTCELVPGSALPVADLARQLGVSLTPVREALYRLAAEGLVDDIPRKGYFVARLNPEGIADLLEARRLIELAAAEQGLDRLSQAQLDEMELLAEEMERYVDEDGRYVDYAEFSRRDSQFHLLTVGSAGNQHLVKVYRGLSVHLHIYRTNLAERSGNSLGLTDVKQHRAIVDGFRSRRLPLLKDAISRHVRQVASALAKAGPGV